MDSSLDPKLQEQLQKLQQKYAVMGQDLSSYLDGLLHSDYLTYCDYIHLDTLLSLQNPKTHFKDEKFLKFRMALLPASGFQSAQYRMIEISSTDLINLVDPQYRDTLIEYSNLN